MKRYFAVAAVCVALGLAFASPAFAGAKITNPILITKNADGSGSFQGTLSDIRAQAAYAWIYCFSYAWPGSGGNYSYCYASDGSQGASCSTRDPNLVDKITRLAGDSYVYLAYDASGTCTTVSLGQGSWTSPKQP